jgi:hypothetical protein
MEVSSQLHTAVALSPRKEPQVLIGEKVRWAPEPVSTLWSREKPLSPANKRTLAIQPADCHYTD